MNAAMNGAWGPFLKILSGKAGRRELGDPMSCSFLSGLLRQDDYFELPINQHSVQFQAKTLATSTAIHGIGRDSHKMVSTFAVGQTRYRKVDLT